METAGEQGQVGLRLVAEESRPPDPGPSLGRFLGCHKDRLASIAQEIIAVVTNPLTPDAGKRTRVGSPRDHGGERK